MVIFLLLFMHHYVFAGGPGGGKGTQCAKIAARYSGVVHLSVGDLLRKEIADKGTAEDKWKMAGQLVQKGEMVPQVSYSQSHLSLAFR